MVNNVGNNGQIQKLSQLQEAQKRQQKLANAPGTPSFKQVLEKKVAQSETPLRFSSHAEKRLESREIEITPKHLERMAEAVEKAKTKGAKETLMIFEDFSLIVSVKNNTVITAVENAGMRENVFTNIDSAVFA